MRHHITGRATCDADTGSVKRGWKMCGRKAVCESETVKYGIILHWCEHHKHKAEEEGRQYNGEVNV